MKATYQDKRVVRSRAAVLSETYDRLTRDGWAGVSIDDIAQGFGVAKTTIYRHWPNRSALLIDACAQMGQAQETPDLGSLRSDLTRLLGAFVEGFREAAWAKAIPSIIDAADRDERIATMQADMHDHNMTPFVTIIERARIRGEVRADIDARNLVALILGPLFYRRWFSNEPIDHDFLSLLVDVASSFAKPG